MKSTAFDPVDFTRLGATFWCALIRKGLLMVVMFSRFFKDNFISKESCDTTLSLTLSLTFVALFVSCDNRFLKND